VGKVSTKVARKEETVGQTGGVEFLSEQEKGERKKGGGARVRVRDEKKSAVWKCRGRKLTRKLNLAWGKPRDPKKKRR